jgi:hypothetical protein
MNLTCVILSYKNHQWLERAVKSVAEQTRKPERTVILAMDGVEAPDQLAQSLAKQYGFECELNSDLNSCPAAKNYAWKIIQNPWTATGMTLDADDWVDPDYVKECLGRMEHGEADIVGAGYSLDFLSGDSRPAKLPPCGFVLARNPLPCWSIVKTKAFQLLGGYKYVQNEDWHLWQDAYSAGYKLERVDKSLGHYFRWPGALSGSIYREKVQ